MFYCSIYISLSNCRILFLAIVPEGIIFRFGMQVDIEENKLNLSLWLGVVRYSPMTWFEIHSESGPNTGSEFGRRYKRSDFSRVMNVVCNPRHAAGVWGHTVNSPSGFHGQSLCKPTPRIVSTGLETYILIPFSLLFINYYQLRTT